MVVRYGKARDAEVEPSVVVDDKKLIEEMKLTEKLQFTSYGPWDNGKVGPSFTRLGTSKVFVNFFSYGGGLSSCAAISVADPDSFFTDPDPGIFFQSGSGSRQKISPKK